MKQTHETRPTPEAHSTQGEKRARWRRYPVSKARLEFAETLNKVAYGGEWVILQKHGKDLAGFIPAFALHAFMDLLKREREALSRGLIDERELARLMGWKESEVRTVSRSAKLKRLSAFFQRLWDATGSLPAAQNWLNATVQVLGDRSPKEVMLRKGLPQVEQILMEVEAGPAV